MQSLDLEKLNNILANIVSPSSSVLKPVLCENGVVWPAAHPRGYDEDDHYSYIYQVVDEDELYVRITYKTDSYGSNDRITSIAFVRPIKKTIIGFEPI